MYYLLSPHLDLCRVLVVSYFIDKELKKLNALLSSKAGSWGVGTASGRQRIQAQDFWEDPITSI